MTHHGGTENKEMENNESRFVTLQCYAVLGLAVCVQILALPFLLPLALLGWCADKLGNRPFFP
jgi:hypothetical protein